MSLDRVDCRQHITPDTDPDKYTNSDPETRVTYHPLQIIKQRKRLLIKSPTSSE